MILSGKNLQFSKCISRLSHPTVKSQLLLLFLAVFITNCLSQSGEAKGAGLARLCKQELPDGFVVVESKSRVEYLLVISVDDVWAIEIHAIADAMAIDSDALLKRQNSLDVYDVFVQFPKGFRRIFSTRSRNKTEWYHNNIFVLVQGRLFRYRLIDVESSSGFKPVIDVKYVNDYSTEFWWPFNPDIKWIFSLYSIYDSRLVVFRKTNDASGTGYVGGVISLSEGNFDNPIHHITVSDLQTDVDRYAKYHIETVANASIVSLLHFNFNICLDLDRCVVFSRLIDCDNIGNSQSKDDDNDEQNFRFKFIHWLHNNTEFTIRLLAITLISIIVVNCLFVLIFLVNQLKNVALLARVVN